MVDAVIDRRRTCALEPAEAERLAASLKAIAEPLDELRQVPTRTGRPNVSGADLQTHSTVSKRV